VKSRRLKRAGLVIRIGERRKAQIIFVGKPLGKLRRCTLSKQFCE
jgi:hypothetical protein